MQPCMIYVHKRDAPFLPLQNQTCVHVCVGHRHAKSFLNQTRHMCTCVCWTQTQNVCKVKHLRWVSGNHTILEWVSGPEPVSVVLDVWSTLTTRPLIKQWLSFDMYMQNIHVEGSESRRLDIRGGKYEVTIFIYFKVSIKSNMSLTWS